MIKIKFEFNIHVQDDRPIEPSSLQREGITPPSCRTDFVAFAESEIHNARQRKRFSTARNHQTAVRSFINFTRQTVIPLDTISEELIDDYQQWLRQKSICPNTISCYMRCLRSIYNKAIDASGTTPRNPFGKAYTGHAATIKRSIPAADIRKIKEADLHGKKSLQLTRDIFLFCYYTLGMPFVDVAFLKTTNIQDSTIIYYRHKTGQQIRIKLEPCMTDIISAYHQPHSPYLFPIITTDDEEHAHHQYLTALGNYNRNLKRIAQLAKVSCKLTSYVARHSWASNAYEENVDLPVISKALGHTDTKTTLIYIRGINDARLEQANRDMLSKI